MDPARGKEPPLYVWGLGVPLGITGMIYAFHAVKTVYHKTSGRQVYHMILGFNQVEEALLMSSHMIDSYAYQVAYYFYNLGYQTVYAVHRNQENLHIHIVINSVSYVDGRKYQTDFGTGKKELEEYFNWLLWGYIHQPMQPIVPVKYQAGDINGIPRYRDGMPPICPIEFFDIADELEYSHGPCCGRIL